MCDNISMGKSRRAWKGNKLTERVDMKLLERAAALFVAAAVTLSGLTAFAEGETGESLPEAAGTETAVIDSGERTETEIIDPDDIEGSGKPESGVDLSDKEYEPIDISGYTEWDGKTKMQPNTNYYIAKTVKLKKSFTVPLGSALVMCSGSKLVVYKDNGFTVKGRMLVEPDASLTVSGKFVVNAGAGVECYGYMSATKSSAVQIASEFIVRNGAKAVMSGSLNVYKNGILLNYGITTLTANSVTRITGEMQTPAEGRLYLKGSLGVTISGRSTMAGFFSLTGEFINSGVFIMESTVRFYKAKTARFAVSKSSRLIDYRNNTDSTGGGFAKPTDIGAKGIDVSYAQGAVDWAAVKAAGVDFAMIRASRGAVGGKPIAKDSTFDYNITEATKNNIKVGVYHYIYATTTSQAKKEARFFLKTIEPYRITYPVVLDVEEQYQADLGKKKITNIVKAFLDEVNAAGYYTMLYSNKAWLTNYLDTSKLTEHDIWLAQWNTVPTYEGEFGMWQYSSKGIVSGIEGYVDLNISYKEYTQIIRDGKYNRLTL